MKNTRLPFFLFLILAACKPARASSPEAEAADLANKGRYEEAADKFQEAIRASPQSASLRLGLGVVYKSLKRYREAVNSLEEAVRLSPDLADGYYSLALLYEAAAINPGLLGGAAQPQGYWPKAKEAWEKVLSLERDPQKKETAKRHLKKISEELK